MKIIVPKHVEAGMFDMGVDIGPFRVKMWQLFLIGIGVGITFSIANALMKRGYSTMIAFILGSPAFFFMLFISFFKKTELAIIPFILKILRTYVFQSTKIFQVNRPAPQNREIKLEYFKLEKGESKKVTSKKLDDVSKDLEILKKFS